METMSDVSTVLGATGSVPLHLLGWKAFQDLAVAVAEECLRRPVQTFLPTNDAGRDGGFVGLWEGDDPAAGESTIQCKFTSRAGENLTLSMLQDELPKATRLAQRGLAQDYIIITNHPVTGASELKIREAFQQAGVGRCRIFGHDFIVRQIKTSPRFRLSFLPYKTGAIGKDGITFNHLKFRSRTLQVMRNCGVRSVRYHYDPEDIRKIYGCDDKGGIFEIPCVKSFHQKISLTEWGEMHEEIAQNGSRYTDADLARHYQLHDEILGQGARLRTKRRKSRRLSKRGSKPAPAPFAALKPSALARRLGQDGEGSDA